MANIPDIELLDQMLINDLEDNYEDIDTWDLN